MVTIVKESLYLERLSILSSFFKEVTRKKDIIVEIVNIYDLFLTI